MAYEKDGAVSDTKIRKPKESETPFDVQTRIECKGKAAGQVLEEISLALSDAEAKELDPMIVLENLALLRDSVVTLIKGVCRLLVGYSRAVTFWESSGYTEAFLSVMEAENPSAR